MCHTLAGTMCCLVRQRVLEICSGIPNREFHAGTEREKSKSLKLVLTSGRKLIMIITNKGLEYILLDEKQFRMFIAWAMRDAS